MRKNFLYSKFFKNAVTVVLVIGLCNQVLAAENDEIKLNAREEEFKKIYSDLTELHQKIKNTTKISLLPGLGPQKIELDRSFLHGSQAFQKKEWITATEELSNFMALSQNPDSERWLKAHFMLGRSFEELGQPQRAVRFYVGYLQTFTTKPNKNHEELTETFERLVRIATKNVPATSTELSQFLSSIASMEYPSRVSEELKYLSAVASKNIGRRNLSIQWLSEVDDRANEKETKARSRYFRALIAISEQDWSTASDQLEGILAIDGISDKTKENVAISLARVLVQLKKFETALNYYSKIPETSLDHKDASFEKIFLLMKLNQDDRAKEIANNWLNRHSEDRDSHKVRGILSLLELRAGNLELAKNQIDQNVKNLTLIQSEIEQSFTSSKLTYDDAVKLHTLTKAFVQPAPELEHIISMYENLSVMNQRLTEIQATESNIVYALSKENLEQYKPRIGHQVIQLEQLVDDSLVLGSKLSHMDKARLKERLSEVDRQKLSSSEKRRLSLFSKRSQIARSKKRWQEWLLPVEQLAKLAAQWNRLQEMEASLYASHQNSADDKNLKNDAHRKFLELRQEMLGTLEGIRKERVKGLVGQSPIADQIYILEQYASSLQEDFQILSKYEPRVDVVLDQLDDDDSQKNWQQWQSIVAVLNERMRDLKEEADKDIEKTLAALEKIEKSRIDMDRKIKSLTDVLATYGGEALSGIKSHYGYGINQRLARHYKWSGDLEFLNYEKSSIQGDKSRMKRALEMQILSDQLKDVDQGGALQWPRF